jgi:hypothetical protein
MHIPSEGSGTTCSGRYQHNGLVFTISGKAAGFDKLRL